MNVPARISYWFLLATFVLVGYLQLGTLLLATLFSLFVVHRLHWTKHRRWPAIVLFVALVVLGSFVLARFATQAVVALPAVAQKAIPSIADWAERQGVELPFTDWKSLKEVALETARSQAQVLGRFATGATRELVFLLMGMVVAVTLFISSEVDLDRATHRIRNNLYSLTSEAIAARFRLFYKSFTTVMGAQIVISAINTVLTAIFVLLAGLPNAVVLVGVTFLCGMLPVVGNLLSNAVIVAVAFTVSPRMALVALGFLVVVHKLEYFLNSKIIGDRIRNPVWLTLLGLILGERLMGIPGMILAPVVLAYVKAEAAQIEVGESEAQSAAATAAAAEPAAPATAAAATPPTVTAPAKATTTSAPAA
jgi:predicted PurR-regulated permease PerM